MSSGKQGDEAESLVETQNLQCRVNVGCSSVSSPDNGGCAVDAVGSWLYVGAIGRILGVCVLPLLYSPSRRLGQYEVEID